MPRTTTVRYSESGPVEGVNVNPSPTPQMIIGSGVAMATSSQPRNAVEGLPQPTHVEYWKKIIGVSQHILLQPIDSEQCLDEYGQRGAELVGVVPGLDMAIIYHTRELQEDDIVHELLHVRYPDWNEAVVIQNTAALMEEYSVPS